MLKPQRDVLHSGNILNNGYLHCKYLQRRGIRADCLNVDYSHCQGQPEWTEVPISQPVPEWNADLRQFTDGFVRPEWYLHGTREELPAMERQLAGPPGLFEIFAKSTPVSRTQTAFNRLLHGKHYNPARQKKRSWYDLLIKSYQDHFPEREKQLDIGDLLDWEPRSDLQAGLMKHYPIIQGYGSDAIYALLGAPDKPYICYEHGHLREMPFDDSSTGRLYSLALKRAAKVIITNSDCINAARKLGLENTVFIPHLIDDEKFRPGSSPLRETIKAEMKCDYILLAPARHHWKNLPSGFSATWNKGNDVIIRGVAALQAERPELRICLVFFNWGQEVDQSRELIDECGISQIVRWEELRSKPVVRDYINAADVVLDQFNPYTGTFGAIVPETMACAKPIMMTYKPEAHDWCYPLHPPVISANSTDQIKSKLDKLLEDESYRRRIGDAGYEWYQRHHSSDVVVGRMNDVYRDLWDRIGHVPRGIVGP